MTEVRRVRLDYALARLMPDDHVLLRDHLRRGANRLSDMAFASASEAFQVISDDDINDDKDECMT